MSLTILKLGSRTGDSFVPWIIKWNYFTLLCKATHASNSDTIMEQFSWTSIAINVAKWEYDPKTIFAPNVFHDLDFTRCLYFHLIKKKQGLGFFWSITSDLFHHLSRYCRLCSVERYWFPFFSKKLLQGGHHHQ